MTKSPRNTFVSGMLGPVDTVTVSDGENSVTLRDAVLADHDDEYGFGSFVVDLVGDGLAATRSVFVIDGSGLDVFFAELAEHWRGWEGMRSWASAEYDLSIDARAASGGHNHLRFIARNGPIATWSAHIDVVVDAGEEMTFLARELAAFLSPLRR